MCYDNIKSIFFSKQKLNDNCIAVHIWQVINMFSNNRRHYVYAEIKYMEELCFILSQRLKIVI